MTVVTVKSCAKLIFGKAFLLLSLLVLGPLGVPNLALAESKTDANPYTTLNVSPNASAAAVDAAFVREMQRLMAGGGTREGGESNVARTWTEAAAVFNAYVEIGTPEYRRNRDRFQTTGKEIPPRGKSIEHHFSVLGLSPNSSMSRVAQAFGEKLHPMVDELEDLVQGSPETRTQFINLLEAFLAIRSHFVSVQAKAALNVDGLLALLEQLKEQSGYNANLKAMGIQAERQAGLRRGSPTTWTYPLAIGLGIFVSKTVLESAFHLDDSNLNIPWLTSVGFAVLLDVLLPILYVSKTKVDFGGWAKWVEGAYRRALLTSLSASIIVGSCVRYLH